MLTFWNEASTEARRALIAASLGWLLDAFDVMLYALVLTSLMRDLEMTPQTAGLLGSLTLAASAVGGMVFGVIADRWGRTRALSLSILIYSIFTAACGFAQDVTQLAIFRVCLGIGFGGEWASGAALVSETWPAKHRGKALGLMQSSWAIGYGAAAIVTALILPRFGWRAVFFVGVLPALITLWIRRNVREPEMWQRARVESPSAREASSFSGSLIATSIAITLMNAATMFAWWGLNLWIPAYLSLPEAQGGVGLSTVMMSGFIVAMQVGMWFGYVTYGFVSDRVGRKPTYITYLVVAAALVFVYSVTKTPVFLLLLGPFVGFFGTGYFSGFGAVTAELFPTAIRATAQGITYNIGRLASAVAPFLVGTMAQTRGFGAAFTMTSIAFLIAAAFWIAIPETRGRQMK